MGGCGDYCQSRNTGHLIDFYYQLSTPLPEDEFLPFARRAETFPRCPRGAFSPKSRLHDSATMCGRRLRSKPVPSTSSDGAERPVPDASLSPMPTGHPGAQTLGRCWIWSRTCRTFPGAASSGERPFFGFVLMMASRALAVTIRPAAATWAALFPDGTQMGIGGPDSQFIRRAVSIENFYLYCVQQ